jgi:hypothetical protein
MAKRIYNSTSDAVKLAASLSNSTLDTTLVVDDSSTLPVLATGQVFTLVIDPDVSGLEEIVTVTAKNGTNTYTVVRASNGSSVKNHAVAAVVKHMVTARDLQEPQDHIEATSAYQIKNDNSNAAITTTYITKTLHGIATNEGDVVGTLKSQTLTNKTLTSPTINNAGLTGTITNSATITGGTINASTLSGTTVNSGIITGGTLAGTVTNSGTISGGTLSSNTISTPTISTPTISNAILSGTTNATSGTIDFGTNANAITANGNPISAAELGYIDGVTSPIQTQLNNKAASTIGTWSTWTGLSVSGGISAIGNGTLTARYTSINKTTHFELQFTVGSTTTFSNTTAIAFTLPTSAESTESPNWMAGNLFVAGSFSYSGYYALNCRLIGSSITPFCLPLGTSNGTWSALTPTNLAGSLPSGSVITINGTYEAA